MKIAVEGCCHGDLDNIYSHISTLEAKHGYKVDLLVICGDFQAVRNWADLECMSVPNKYKALKDFYKYYSGEKVAPLLTIVIGGNHEASNYMHELYHGGWLAPNLYFLGHAGSVIVNGIRISGTSGIFAPYDFRHGLHEKLPYDKGTMRSIYHTREFCIRRLSLLPSPQVFLSHDWPLDITSFGTSHATPAQSLQALLKIKPFWKEEVRTGKLGSQPLMGLLRHLKPEWWFSAHMHVRFEAMVVHQADESISQPAAAAAPAAPPAAQQNPDEIVIDFDDDEALAAPGSSATPGNPDEIVIDFVEDEPPAAAAGASSSTAEPPTVAPANPEEIVVDEELDDEEPPAALADVPPAPALTRSRPNTRFLALDKCIPRRNFLEVVDITPPPPGSDPTIPASTYQPAEPTSPASGQSLRIFYDPHWLAITRAFQPFLSTSRHQVPFPPTEEAANGLVQKELQWVMENVPKKLRAASGTPEDGDGDAEETWEIKHCQNFVQTAPVEANPGDGKTMPRGIRQPPWYPNPQTEAFCKLLEIEDRINRSQVRR